MARTALALPGAAPPPKVAAVRADPADPISVILMVHNEAGTIEGEIRTMVQSIVARLPGSELIVAEDGSTDGTKAILTRLARECGIIHSTGPERKGYTRALRDALALAQNPYVFFSDTGGKFDLRDFWRLYAQRKSAGLVLGVRAPRSDQPYRRALTAAYNALVRRYFRVPLHDADSGFRLYDTRLVRELLAVPWVFKNLVGSELALRAVALGYAVKEVTVAYQRRGTRSRGLPPKNIPRVIRQTLWSFPELRRRLRHRALPAR